MRISDWSSDVCSSDLEGCHLDARLPARPLLGQHELPAGEVAARLGQQHGRLQGKHLVAVEILVQAVVVAGIVAQQQRRRDRKSVGEGTSVSVRVDLGGRRLNTKKE